MPYACGLSRTVTFTLAPGWTVAPFAPLVTIVKSFGFRPAMYARSTCIGAAPPFDSVTVCVALSAPGAVVWNFGAADSTAFGAGVSAGPALQPPTAAGPPAMVGPFS